ncbi:MAG: hypothetical protein AMJ46_06945 [Latescibacteria bacterium DG_63]|nr:MAG: hypothetical protein AMJ46_06945 [Latescibacteria bacterium DG_63]
MISGLLAGALTVFLVALHIYTEVLWFEELDQVARYWTVFGARIWLFLAGFAASLIFFYVQMLVSTVRAPEDIKSRMRLPNLVYFVYAIIVSIILGNASSGWWEKVLLYMNQVPFGTSDPIFDKDAAFYVFALPLFSGLKSYLLALLILSTLGVLGLYAVQLGLRPDTLSRTVVFEGHFPVERRQTLFRLVTHMSVQGVLFVCLFIFQTILAIWNLVYSERGAVFGAGYTDVHVQVGAYKFFIGALILVAVVFLLSAVSRSHRRTVRAAWIALGILLLTWLVGAKAIPAIVQQYVVSPNELDKERPYIEYNIAYTREAFGLEGDKITSVDFPVKDGITPLNLKEDEATLKSIRLWDWRVLEATYNQNQSFRLYYRFMDVDIDRYVLDGMPVQVMLSARELDQRRLAEKSKTWQNLRLVYTHGYGLCLNPVNIFTPEGLPEYWTKDIPPVSSYPELQLDRPEIYFGEAPNSHVFVKTSHAEFDYPRGAENVTAFYEGKGGVDIGGGLRKLAFALRFDGLRLLTARELGPQSRIMFRRPVQERVPTLAPFLVYDRDPYQVIADGKIWFIWDAYTVSDHFPYAERYFYRRAREGRINYIRNSVKVVVNAYDGTVDFYIFEDSDPIVQAYAKIFPGFFKSADEMPDVLRAHVRYPEDFLKIQADIYSVYHMSDPTVFYNREDAWEIAWETYQGDTREVLPYYVVITVPGEKQQEFIQMIPFTPLTTDRSNPKHNMVAWLAGRCDGDRYGEILVYHFPKERLVYGPMQIEIRINQNDNISKDFTLWNQQGSRVIQGNLLVIPLADNRLLYVEPVYLQATVGKMPELKRVITSSGDDLTYSTSFEESLAQLIRGRRVSASEPSASREALTLSQQVRRAAEHFRRYQQLTGQGKIAEAGVELERLSEALEALRRMSE